MTNQASSEKPGKGPPSGATLVPTRYAYVLGMPAFGGHVSNFLTASGETETAGASTVQAKHAPSVDSDVVKLLLNQNQDDRNRITTLEREVAELRDVVGLKEPEIRSVSRAQAKKEIKAYFEKHDGETVFPSDVAEALTLDYDLVVELIDELETNGQIAKA